MDLKLERPDDVFRETLRTYAKDLSSVSQSEGLNRDEILRRIQKLTAQLVSAFSTEERNIKNSVDLANELQEHYEKLFQNETLPLNSGMGELDRLLVGFQDECVYLFCARPGQGKTSILMTIARNMLDSGKCVYVASAEMSGLALGKRLVGYYGNFPVCFQKPGISDNDVRRLYDATAILAEKQLYVNDTPCIAVEAIDSDLRYLSDEGVRVDAVMIDYVQLVTSRIVRDQTDGFKVGSAVSMATTMLAKKYHLPLICAGQQNREVDKRATKSGKLSDLRGTGQLEQDAHMVAFLHNERPEKTTDERVLRVSRDGDLPSMWECDIQVEKHRDGATGWAKLKYDAPLMEFGEL